VRTLTSSVGLTTVKDHPSSELLTANYEFMATDWIMVMVEVQGSSA